MGSYEQETQRQDGDKRFHVERMTSGTWRMSMLKKGWMDVCPMAIAVLLQIIYPLLSSLDGPEQSIL